jgi:hypothetical protein
LNLRWSIVELPLRRHRKLKTEIRMVENMIYDISLPGIISKHKAIDLL